MNTIIDLRLALPRHPRKKFPRRKISQIDTIVIHHTAATDRQSINSIARYHVGPNHICKDGCAGICYHFAINRKAYAYQLNDLENTVWHASPMNTRSIGIVLVGNYDQIEPTAEQIKSLEMIIDFCFKKTGKNLNIITHRTACNNCKSCPGVNMYPIVTRLREKYLTA